MASEGETTIETSHETIRALLSDYLLMKMRCTSGIVRKLCE